MMLAVTTTESEVNTNRWVLLLGRKITPAPVPGLGIYAQDVKPLGLTVQRVLNNTLRHGLFLSILK